MLPRGSERKGEKMSDHRVRRLPDGEELVWTDPVEVDTPDPRASASERRRLALAKEPAEGRETKQARDRRARRQGGLK
jgi:hypothetical protein